MLQHYSSIGNTIVGQDIVVKARQDYLLVALMEAASIGFRIS